MSNELDPVVDQWYTHYDKGQDFCVTAVDEDAGTIEIQHFDGDLEEVGFEEWRLMDIELAETPENTDGPLDVGDLEDLGPDVIDTSEGDWTEEQSEYHDRADEHLTGDDEVEVDVDDDGAMEELLDPHPDTLR